MKDTSVLMNEFKEGIYESLLKDIYVDDSVLEYQKERYIKSLNQYEEIFGKEEVEIYSAPGRSEVGGNHTDHQYGKVLATSINLDAIAVTARTGDEKITVVSDGYERMEIGLNDLLAREDERETSLALIRGVAARLKQKGYKIGGFRAYITSDVLIGAGMSSSAAYETLIGTILSGLYNEMKLDPVFLAQAGQYAENEYFGKRCGLLDQMSSSV